jgi:antitoxin VapB
MALNIKDPETERLAAEVAQLAGESKTRAVKIALQERKKRLSAQMGVEARKGRLLHFLEAEVWPQIPPEVRGKPLTKEEEEEILGIGPDGV